MSDIERLLNDLINGQTEDFEPNTRVEAYLKACCERCGCGSVPTPITRIDALLYRLAELMPSTHPIYNGESEDL